MHLFSEIRRVSSIVDRNGGGNPALTGPLLPLTGTVKIHRHGGPLRGLFNTALKLARRPDV